MTLDAHDAVRFGEWLSDVRLSTMGYRIAAIRTAQGVERARVFETAVRNRSINFRMFTDTELARAWLLA